MDSIVRLAVSRPASSGPALVRAELVELLAEGLITVQCADGTQLNCEALEPQKLLASLSPGDTVLVLMPLGDELAVVLGRIGRLAPAVAPPQVTIEASETLSLRCGEASVDLRADGKVMIRGEDVLVRAKGTQRIRAGTVAIN